ncbi:hypothetical protein GALL_438940 [mine drainage metagenome]|uniref:Uncharacterized protein n=1 Tax=mine drainage metagenome TaxID=410659 RepID=A0A1J5PUC9_9ZZZZ
MRKPIRRPAPAGGNALVRAKARHPPAAGLGNPALRSLLAPPRPGLGTPGDAVPDHPESLRRGHRFRRHGPGAPAAAGFSRGSHFHAGKGTEIRSGSVAPAMRRSRVPPCQPGHGAGRVQHPRRTDRPVPDGQRPALPYRPVRRRDRNHPHLRCGQPAQPVPGGRNPPATGARVPAGFHGGHPFPPEFPRTVRGRPLPLPHLQGGQQRQRAGRHRMVSAAVLRCDRHPVRLPAR